MCVSTVCDLETRRLRKEKHIPTGDGVTLCVCVLLGEAARTCVFVLVYTEETKAKMKRGRGREGEDLRSHSPADKVRKTSEVSDRSFVLCERL